MLDKPKLRPIIKKKRPVIFKNISGMELKERQLKAFQIRETEKTSTLGITTNPGLDPLAKKDVI